jgi:tRNA (mo5U34)-methyltransferase
LFDHAQLSELTHNSPFAELAGFLHPEFISGLKHGDLPGWLECLANLPQTSPSAVELNPAIQIGRHADLSASEHEQLLDSLRRFIPWRKGPFGLFGHHIDSEWRCELKWQRLAPIVQELAGEAVLDVGSGNGYYCLRLAGAGARLALGVDPHLPYVMQFWLLKRYLQQTPAFVLPVSLEQLPESLPHFDTVMSMGVIYHRRSPLDHLTQLARMLRPGGRLIMETIVVDGKAGTSLTPEGKYARMPNVWFLPTVDTLSLWLKRSRFSQIELLDLGPTTIEEQRPTEWMPFASFDEALDPDNPALTVEGYPAPQRAVMVARKS